MKRLFGVYLDEDLVLKLDRIAKSEDRSRNYIIERLIVQQIAKNQTQGDTASSKGQNEQVS